MSDIQTVVDVANAFTVLCGGFVAFRARGAYRRTGSEPLRALAIGIATVAVGSLLASVAAHATDLGVRSIVVVQSALTGLGFTVLASSLFVSFGAGPYASESREGGSSPGR
jgi:hypothetical protein